ncbi:MAG: hypothetical protein ACJ763_18100 [Bdellovibrionia bacterium]
MTTSWSFSRCYQCGGYALVRKAEVNIIKVDRAPAGEKVLLPESSENPLLSEAATRTLNRYTNNAGTSASQSASSAAMSAAPAAHSDKPVVKPATRRNTASGMINPLHAANTSHVETDRSNPLAAMDLPFDKISHPQPFAPVSQEAGARPLSGPNAPAGASVDRNAMPSYMNGVNGVNNMGLFPEPLPEVPAAAGKIRLLPMAIGIAAAFALGSGLYLLMQSGEIIEKTRPTLSDRHQAPARAEESDTVAQTSHPITPVAVAKVAQAQPNTGYSDQVRSQAMAPERMPAPTAPHPVQLSSDNPPLVVQPKAKNIHLRSGPGMVYPVVGNADERAKYVVTDWNDRWFKVLPQSASASQNGEEIAGWIRTDSVQVVPAATNGTVTN